jgi:hypothetical protein
VRAREAKKEQGRKKKAHDMSNRNVRIPTLEPRHEVVGLHLEWMHKITLWHRRAVRQIRCGLEARLALAQCGGIAQVVGDYLFTKPVGALLDESWVVQRIRNRESVAGSGATSHVSTTADAKNVPGVLWPCPEVVATTRGGESLGRTATDADVDGDDDDDDDNFVQAVRMREILAWSAANSTKPGCCMGNHRLECAHRMFGVVFNTCSTCFNSFDVREHAEEKRLETNAVDYCSSCAAAAFECIVCRRAFWRWADLQAHMAIEAQPAHMAIEAQPAHMAIEAQPAHMAIEAQPAHMAIEAQPAHARVPDQIWGADGDYNVAESKRQPKIYLSQSRPALSVSDATSNLQHTRPVHMSPADSSPHVTASTAPPPTAPFPTECSGVSARCGCFPPLQKMCRKSALGTPAFSMSSTTPQKAPCLLTESTQGRGNECRHHALSDVAPSMGNDSATAGDCVFAQILSRSKKVPVVTRIADLAPPLLPPSTDDIFSPVPFPDSSSPSAPVSSLVPPGATSTCSRHGASHDQGLSEPSHGQNTWQNDVAADGRSDTDERVWH